MRCMEGMCKRRSSSVAYFGHDPNHRLLPVDTDGEDGEFKCDGCLVAGAGPRYLCSHPGCGFKLHVVCARRFPRTLKSVVHAPHRLRRRESAADHGAGGGSCEVCGEDVKGACYAYGRGAGGAGTGIVVVVHPLCVRLPPVARGPAPAHPAGHDAWLVKKSNDGAAAAGACAAACGRGLGVWRYRCETCRLDFHPRCLVPAVDQCRGVGGEAPVGSTGKRCCLAFLQDVMSCLNISYYYRGSV